MKNEVKKLVCVVGPTSSGKTGLGVAQAKKFDGEIVSADSRQVYRHLDIGTGKEGQPDTNLKFKIQNLKLNSNSKFKIENLPSRIIDGVNQWLIDICEPEESFTMFDWLDLARKVLDDIWSRGKTPIVVGGTGLYVQALIEGFAVDKTEELRNRETEELYRRKELEEKNREELAEILMNMNEEAFLTVDINNPARVIRAIEKAQSGEEVTKNKADFDYLLIGKDMPREELYAKIDRRVEEWFKEGFYEEVKGLLESGVSLEWLNKIGLEYRILANYITYQKSKACTEHARGIKNQNEDLEIESLIENCKLKIENFSSLDSVKQAMKYAIHQYARRQLTWWRRFDVTWAKDCEEAETVASEFLNIDK